MVVFSGPPGVGKGTVASRLAADLGYEFVSSGDLLRHNVREDTPLGREAKGYIESGGLVPDELVTRMVLDHLGRVTRGIFLDGYPRTLTQARDLSVFLAAHKLPLVVVDLFAADEFLENRLTGRLICRNCGKIYHRVNLPPRRESVCDECGGRLYQREDDSVAVVRKRLAVYHEQSAPVRDFYLGSGVIHTLPGDAPLAETLSVVRRIVSGQE